jgi:hypothetical protein
VSLEWLESGIFCGVRADRGSRNNEYRNGNGVLCGPCLVRRWLAENGVSAEAEESSLLEAVVREQLVKTPQAREDLASDVVICELCRLAVAL